MNTHQQLLTIIEQLPDAQLSSLIDLAVAIKNKQDSLEKIQVDSQAYQEWLSPDNDIYDELLQMKLQRGDMILCRVPMPSTQLTVFKLRPAVVISANEINQILDDVIIVPCTSNNNRPLTLRQYLITGDEIMTAGVKVESIVRCESIFTINKLMIIKKLGYLSGEAIAQINGCLKIALTL